jgi:hypothetical protein
MEVPIDTPVSQPLGRTGRILGVLAFVLTVHAWALYQAALSMAMMPPAEVTQATLSVALLAPPAPAAQAAAPSPTPPPRHKSARTPTLPPPAPPAPEPEPEPPPEAAEPLEPTAEPMPEPPSEAPVEPAPAPDEPAQPSLIDGAQALPTQGRIVYRTTYSRLRGLTALTFVDWIVDLERARYELWLRTVDPGGLLDLRSMGSLQPFGIAPDRYVERIELTGRELRAEFDWASRIVQFAGRGATAPTGFGEGAQDPLSLQFQLPLLAQAYPWRFTPGAEISFAVARRGVENYTFVVEGFESVRIGGQDVPALKIDRKRNADVRRRVEIWMSPDHQWLPVRLRFTDTNDEVWDNVLTQLPGPPGSEPPPEPIVQEPVKP